jgi:two-component system chemotaxis response regulator CheY
MSAASKIRIVIIEDRRAIASLLRSSLRDIGFDNLIEHRNVDDALTDLTYRPADLVISELKTARLDGLALLRALRMRPSLASTPVLMVANRANAGLVREAVELGAYSFLVKPFTLKSLKKKIEDVVGVWA